MSYSSQQQAPAAAAFSVSDSYPAPGQARPNYVAPPPPGYPVKDGPAYSQQVPVETKSRDGDDGFWKGCCAALCCCCVLESCF